MRMDKVNSGSVAPTPVANSCPRQCGGRSVWDLAQRDWAVGQVSA